MIFIAEVPPGFELRWEKYGMRKRCDYMAQNRPVINEILTKGEGLVRGKPQPRSEERNEYVIRRACC
jgi:hypothetical protein